MLLFNKPDWVPCPGNNPHCDGSSPEALPLENWIIATLIVIAILIYTFYIMKPKVKITAIDAEKLYKAFQESSLSIESLRIAISKIDKISRFEKAYDKISTFLWGEKSFRWGELKGF